MTKPKEQLWRHSLGALKTIARIAGRGMKKELDLFANPIFDYDTKLERQRLQKKACEIMHSFIENWQKHKDSQGIYTIKNLTTFADKLSITPRALKIYLIYLGGYTHPITEQRTIKVEGKKPKNVLSIYSDFLFRIRFNISLRIGETEKGFTNDDRVGTSELSFIKDRDIYSIDIIPTRSFIKEITGKGLGYIFVPDRFLAFTKGLSVLAYKILCFSGSNKPKYPIRFEKLISKENLNLVDQVYGVYNGNHKCIRKGAGKARTLQALFDALDELLKIGHFTTWAYDEDRDMFTWACSDKVFKHRFHLQSTDIIQSTDIVPMKQVKQGG